MLLTCLFHVIIMIAFTYNHHSNVNTLPCTSQQFSCIYGFDKMNS